MVIIEKGFKEVYIVCAKILFYEGIGYLTNKGYITKNDLMEEQGELIVKWAGDYEGLTIYSEHEEINAEYINHDFVSDFATEEKK